MGGGASRVSLACSRQLGEFVCDDVRLVLLFVNAPLGGNGREFSCGVLIENQFVGFPEKQKVGL